MLILARKVGQGIVIGDDVELKVVEVRADGSVSLGFEAPKSIRIMRKELLGRESKKSKKESES